jgi:thiamine-phosphate pyrophosphorylase
MLDGKGVSVVEFLQIAKANGAEIIQYRNKSADINFVKQQLIYIRKHYDGFLIVNDFYELVAYCDGVHIGQEDLRCIDEDIYKAVQVVRSVIQKDKILGISTHNEKEVLQANLMDLNYIGLGPYRTTDTKKDLQTVLGDSIDAIAKLSKHYVAAIGGVRLSDKFKNVTYHVVGSGLLV